MRLLCRTDLYYLLWFVCGRKDVEHEWVLQRCRDVEREPDDRLDLWAREHFKSSIITFGKTLQDVLASHGDEPLVDDEVTIGIFSHSRPIAKGFLRQIKRECETNALLKALFPDVLWQNPEAQAPTWSEDGGLIFRRKSNPKEATVEAWGLIDGQPIGKHFRVLMYDDVVVLGSVSNPDMIKKTTDALSLSYNLGAHGGARRFAGTRYHFNDSYNTVMERKTAAVRLHPATIDGTVTGEPVLLSREQLNKKRADMGPYVFGCQMLLDPKSEQKEGFKEEWLRYFPKRPTTRGNRYILVDPANDKKKKSDYTAAGVIELREDRNYYVLDLMRDRLSLTERADLVFKWHREFQPLGVGYEQYGMQSDIAHMEDRMTRESYNFKITPLAGQLAKNERIKRLVPVCEQARWYLPDQLVKDTSDGRLDLVRVFVRDEYVPFPVMAHDDVFDMFSRILDDELNAVFPTINKYVPPTVWPSDF